MKVLFLTEIKKPHEEFDAAIMEFENGLARSGLNALDFTLLVKPEAWDRTSKVALKAGGHLQDDKSIIVWGFRLAPDSR